MASHTVDELVVLTSCVRIHPLKQSRQAQEAVDSHSGACLLLQPEPACPAHTAIPAPALCCPGGKGGVTFPASSPVAALRDQSRECTVGMHPSACRLSAKLGVRFFCRYLRGRIPVLSPSNTCIGVCVRSRSETVAQYNGN